MKDDLLPHYTRKIAIAISILAIAIWLINTSTDIMNIETPILTWILKLVILASLLIYIFTKEKNETEKISQLRNKSILGSVGFGVVFLILDTLMELFSAGNYEMLSGYKILMIMLLNTSITFYIRKNIKTVIRA